MFYTIIFIIWYAWVLSFRLRWCNQLYQCLQPKRKWASGTQHCVENCFPSSGISWFSNIPMGVCATRCITLHTNSTPHEQMFSYQHRSSNGHSLPSWLSSVNHAFCKRHVWQSKFDPIGDEVELPDVNPEYDHVKFPNERESIVSIRDLAPFGDTVQQEVEHVHVGD